jgi:mono/diheme cytochrome c family protein
MTRKNLWQILPPILLFGALAVSSVRSQSDQLTPQEERGQQIYLQGTASSGQEIIALIGDEGLEVPASTMPCVVCHGRDGRGRPAEGGVVPSDITWKSLTKPDGVTHESGRKHPPYTEKLLKRAIGMGTDPAGNALHMAMPRYRMAPEDMDELIAYLKRL